MPSTNATSGLPFESPPRGENWYLSGNAWIARRTYPVYMQTYHGDAEGVRYVVDHGNGYFTLNTLHAGQVCPVMQDIAAH